MRKDLILQRKKRRKQIIAATTAAIVAVTGSVFTYSYATEVKNTNEKFANTETVYVMTDNAGKETQRIVSEKGKLHYDGYTKDVLPADVKIKYELNGKEIKPEKLKGKTGTLKMTIHYDTNSVAGSSVPMMAVSGIVTDRMHFDNVTVDHGKVLEDGNRIVIMAFGMPGVEENLHCADIVELPDTVTITGEAKDFELDGMYTFMTKEIFEEVNFDNKFNTAELTSKIDEMTGGVKELKEGASQLDEGTAQLQNGAKALKEGTGTLKDGASALNDGVTALKGGSAQLKDGADKLNAGAGELNDGFGQLTAGSEALVTNTNTLAGAAAQIEAGGQQLSTGTGNLNTALGTISASSSNLNSGAQQIVNSVFAEANTKLNAAGVPVTLTESDYATQIAGIIAMNPSAATVLNPVKAQLDSVVAFKKGLLAYTSGVDQAAAGASALNEGVTALLPGMTQLKNGAAALAGGQSQLSAGISGASAGAGKLKAGTADLVNGHKQLGAGIDKAAAGAAQLKDGSALLYSKEDNLIAGIAELKAGTEKMKEGTSLFDEKINSELEKIKGSNYLDTLKRTADLRNSAKNYKSFGKDGNYESVTFIYKTQGIFKEESK